MDRETILKCMAALCKECRDGHPVGDDLLHQIRCESSVGPYIEKRFCAAKALWAFLKDAAPVAVQIS